MELGEVGFDVSQDEALATSGDRLGGRQRFGFSGAWLRGAQVPPVSGVEHSIAVYSTPSGRQ